METIIDVLTTEQQKEAAIKIMKALDIYEPYIKEYEKSGTVTMFERYGGYYAAAWNGEAELEKLIRDHEEETGNLVYAVIHNYTEFGEMYTLLIISKYEEDLEYNLESAIEDQICFAYVVNVDAPECSEYGSVQIASMGGGINRIG